MEPSQKSPLSLFLKRLLIRSLLTGEEQEAIMSLRGDAARYDARRDIVSPGEIVDSSCLVLKGLVARYDQMLHGHRQVTSYYIPGDMCDLHSVVAPKASWSITAISQATIIRIPHQQLRQLCIEYPAIALAFWRDGTVDSSIFAKWAANFGRKSAKARIAHLICEMGVRLETAQLGARTLFQLPTSQEQLGEACGLTPVHVNRMLQELRRDGLLAFAKPNVEILNFAKLASLAEFDPAYLMLEGPAHRVVPAHVARSCALTD